MAAEHWGWFGRVWTYLTKAPNPKILTARQMWIAGFAGLPLMWLLNWSNFRKAAAKPRASRELKQLVRWSGWAAAIAAVAAMSWCFFFQYRVDDWVCPCDYSFDFDMRCRCALGDHRRVEKMPPCISPEGSCSAQREEDRQVMQEEVSSWGYMKRKRGGWLTTGSSTEQNLS